MSWAVKKKELGQNEEPSKRMKNDQDSSLRGNCAFGGTGTFLEQALIRKSSMPTVKLLACYGFRNTTI